MQLRERGGAWEPELETWERSSQSPSKGEPAWLCLWAWGCGEGRQGWAGCTGLQTRRGSGGRWCKPPVSSLFLGVGCSPPEKSGVGSEVEGSPILTAHSWQEPELPLDLSAMGEMEQLRQEAEQLKKQIAVTPAPSHWGPQKTWKWGHEGVWPGGEGGWTHS